MAPKYGNCYFCGRHPLHAVVAYHRGLYLGRGSLQSLLNSNLRDSIYFSANTYTTIGYGKFILPDNWRELSPIMAISGLFTFAWTTGEMFMIVGMRRDLAADLHEQRRHRLHRQKHHSAAPAQGAERPAAGNEP